MVATLNSLLDNKSRPVVAVVSPSGRFYPSNTLQYLQFMGVLTHIESIHNLDFPIEEMYNQSYQHYPTWLAEADVVLAEEITTVRVVEPTSDTDQAFMKAWNATAAMFTPVRTFVFPGDEKLVIYARQSEKTEETVENTSFPDTAIFEIVLKRYTPT